MNQYWEPPPGQYPQQPAQFQPQFLPPAPYQPQQPPKQSHTVRNVFIVLGVLTFLGIGGCTAVAVLVGNEVNKQANEVHTVVYKVTGTSKAASVVYSTDGSTATAQVASTKLPWSKSLQIKGLFPVYQVTAQNGAGQKGTVSCVIMVDGKVTKTATASGAGAIATCDYIP